MVCLTYKRLLIFFVYLALSVSCSPIALDNGITPYEEFEWADSPGVKNVLRRASQLATIKWTPLRDVPFIGGYFSAGTSIIGVPYSSTKQINKYLGLDVSLHTYMTAVHNPRSVLYTENIGMAPYYGVNCATYYGTVCSSAVEYALDLGIPYPSNILVEQPFFERLESADWTILKPGDVMYRPGHVFMVMKITNAGSVETSTVTYFEAASRICSISTVPVDVFQERVRSERLSAYRYLKIANVNNYSASPYVPVGAEQARLVVYNDSLCPDRGDESVYRVGEKIVINTFDDSFSTLIVKGPEESKYSLQKDIVLESLGPGQYTAYLTDGIKISDKVSFIVANPQVTIKNTGLLHIKFSCEQGTALYYVFCDYVGNFLKIHPFTTEEIDVGEVYVEPLEVDEYFCKVVFQTPYGTVINEPIEIF